MAFGSEEAGPLAGVWPVGDGGPFPRIARVEVLDHLLASLVLEIDVDVGGFAPLCRDEALKQNIDPRGIHGGDAKAKASGYS